MRPSRVITQKRNISADEMYSVIHVCVERRRSFWSWCDVNRSTLALLTKICAKNEFYIFVPSDLDLSPLEF